ncbi:3-hydroxyacyl-CoA dehydrogenase PaaH [Noviherbaspirillum sp. Root189]|uniref:3-hydroxyacyl-CoA dehydrogenase PaaH n=1 Tax=Noviherbaspirillum sp. Root189 TaxID=1736487 RepID=UPI00070B16BA|nr:3-hydroxyacyl-CoA dehydrogenase PaaH [Noviherbaspirillum sp. Root189]KRB70588.1 3-hydroxyacyl-CoA dehydrogenase [Noviherbaspirillum sp. Root189]
MQSALTTSSLVAVVGAGAMGAGIAQIAAAAGHPVKLYDTHPEAVDKALAGIRKTFGMLAEKGRMTQDEADAASQRLQKANALEQLADARLVVEAIVENLDVKRQLFGELEKVVANDCILATNTSSISVTALAAKLALPGRLVGMHFFNPVPLMALVEVISGLATNVEVAGCIFATAAAWGKSPVHAASTPGFIVNRVARPYYGEALRLINEKAATPATIDAIMREAGGFRMGPFELMDLIGHDVNFAVTQSVFTAYYNDPRFTPSLVQQELVNAGFLGRKSGRGFYRYDDGSKPVPETIADVPKTDRVTVVGQSHAIDGIAGRAMSAGASVQRVDGSSGADAFIQCGDAVLCLSDGRTATQRAAEEGIANLVLVDLALDYTNASRLAVTAAAQCDDHAFRMAVGFLQMAGYAVSRIVDVPGMAVMRTVAMLANEAADAVNQGVCDAAGADIAMRKGVNYPQGPLAWADGIGLGYVRRVLNNLARTYGEDRYRVSPLIQQLVWSNTIT